MAIKKCACKNKYQDKKYGKGNRVVNKTSRVTGNPSKLIYRCVVCATVVS